MTTALKIQQSHPLLAYLLRALWRRVDWDSMQASRRRNIADELTDALVPLAISERTTLGFLRAFCTRFLIATSGGAYQKDGEERSSPPAVVLLPACFLPAGMATMTSSLARPGIVAVRWDIAASGIDFEALRIHLNESAPFFATFTTAQPEEGEVALFAPPSTETDVAPWMATLPRRLITPRAFRTIWTLTSNMAHGADTKSGNTSLFRRERIVSPITGEQSFRPFVAGNAIRGLWRDMLFGRLLRLLGLKSTDLPERRAHALFAGGSIEAGADGSHVNVAVRQRARRLCPAWDLLAGCIDEQIMRGLLRIHDAVLVCRENAWLLYDLLAPETMEARPSLAAFTASLPLADNLTQLRLSTRHAHRDLGGSEGSQMIFNTEVLLTGAQVLHSFQLIGLDGVSELAKSCMADLLAEFRDDALVGAKTASAMGRIAFDAYEPGAGESPLPSPAIYQAWVAEHAEEVRGWLLGVPDPSEEGQALEKGPKGKARGKKPAAAVVSG